MVEFLPSASLAALTNVAEAIQMMQRKVAFDLATIMTEDEATSCAC